MLSHKMPSSRFFQRPSSMFRSDQYTHYIHIACARRDNTFFFEADDIRLCSCTPSAMLRHSLPEKKIIPLALTTIHPITLYFSVWELPLRTAPTCFLQASSLLVSNVREPLHKLAPLFPVPAHHHVVPDEHLHARTWPCADADRGDTKARGTVLREARRCVIASSTMDNAPTLRPSSASAPSSTA
jgi:hypothetical protein